MFNDFSSMNNRRIRELIAGNATGSAGVNSVELYGYINCLKDCDAGVQWTLFMPQFAQRQQKGFQIESFEYRTMPEMRFIGKEFMKENPGDFSQELAVFAALDELGEYKSGFDYDILLFVAFRERGGCGTMPRLFGQIHEGSDPGASGLYLCGFYAEA